MVFGSEQFPWCVRFLPWSSVARLRIIDRVVFQKRIIDQMQWISDAPYRSSVFRIKSTTRLLYSHYQSIRRRDAPYHQYHFTSLEICHEFYPSYLCAIPYIHDGLFRAVKKSEWFYSQRARAVGTVCSPSTGLNRVHRLISFFLRKYDTIYFPRPPARLPSKQAS